MLSGTDTPVVVGGKAVEKSPKLSVARGLNRSSEGEEEEVGAAELSGVDRPSRSLLAAGAVTLET